MGEYQWITDSNYQNLAKKKYTRIITVVIKEQSYDGVFMTGSSYDTKQFMMQISHDTTKL